MQPFLNRGLFVVLTLAILVSGFVTFQNPESKQDSLWLVTTRHPEVLDSLEPRVRTQYRKGRIWLVKLSVPFHELGLAARNGIRPIKMDEILQYTPQERRVTAQDEILKILERVELSSYQEALSHLVGFESREIRGLNLKEDSGNELAQDWIQSEFESLGLETSKHCYRDYQYGSECNVLGLKKGASRINEVVIVEAHLDDVGHLKAGADDNASGAMALIEMARVVKDVPLQRSVLFLATNGEESGLNGSRAYVRKLKSEGLLDRVHFVINMDMIGYNSNKKVDIETNREFQAEAEWYSDQVRSYTNLIPNITMPAWGSDHVPFLNEDIPTILTIEHWNTKTPCYHQQCDTLNTLNLDYALEIVKLNIAVLLQKAGQL